MDTLSAAVMLFLIMDPVGNVPVFLAVLKQVPEERRRRVLVRELLLSLAVMLAFFFLGEHVLNLLHLKQEAVSVGGGIVLFLIALRMIFPPHGGLMGEVPEGEPFLVPLAIPFVAGPSVLAALLLLTKANPGRETSWLLAALFLAWTATAVILYFSTYLYKLLRERGLIAMERLMGMILVMMSVQMFLDGVKTYLAK